MYEGIRKAIRRHEENIENLCNGVEAALRNEQLTRIRAENCEKQIVAMRGILGRRFFGRLKWLATGR